MLSCSRPRRYRGYDTRLKYMVRYNILPDKYLNQIPASNISRWKKEAAHKYFGHDIAAQHYEQLQRFAHDDKARKLMKAYWNIEDTFRKVFTAADKCRELLREQGEIVVDTIQAVKPALGLDKALDWFAISKATFQRWLFDIKVQCNASYFGDCVRFNPTQLTRVEVSSMHSMLTSVTFREWPVTSIAYYAMRNNIVSAGLNSWYRVQHLLAVDRSRAVSPKSFRKTGIRAREPDEYWHADVSQMRLADGSLAFIYLVVDNFSRLPLAWRLAKVKSGAILRDTLQKAYDFFRQYKAGKGIKLIVDGGSENNNQVVEDFISKDDTSIDKYIARMDTHFSNSMVEAVFNISKNNYLYHRNIRNFEDLQEHLAQVMHDLRYVRPHGSLKGLIPFEAWQQKKPDSLSYRQKLDEARQKRLQYHQNNGCKGCEDSLKE